MEIAKEMPKMISNNLVGVAIKKGHEDPAAKQLKHAVEEILDIKIDRIKIVRLYTIKKNFSHSELEAIASDCLSDGIFEEIFIETIPEDHYDWSVEIGYKSGVTDNIGRTAQIAIEDYTGAPFLEGETVHASTAYYFKGPLSRENIETIATDLLGNALIENIRIHPCQSNTLEKSLFEYVNLSLSDEKLEELSRKRQLALTLKEMKIIQQYYEKEEVIAQRKKYGLKNQPTDVELEALAQTWSEHCKHKIFNAIIHYQENGVVKKIDSVFKSYIKKATKELWESCPWLVSVFTDNAGIMKINDQYNIAFKVETHNSPSALDPYGGALTGILGVNRDVMGAGVGARPIANTNVLCFAPQNYQGAIPTRLQHPRRVFAGVRKGIEHGGNKSGIPTVNGAILFEDSYLGKPLVYCGTVGIMPAVIKGQPTHVKEILADDLIIIAGGRTGIDGIHGATFSSEELHAESPSSAVQIGDPFTQKKLCDFLLDARDQGLYRTLTDNGAGGFSSSIGELAQLSGGCEILLDKALLKYPGLAPWEILLSESQERMTLAAPSTSLKALLDLAALHEVEIVVLGKFTDSGFFHALYHGQTVALLSLSFMHDDLPQMELEAEWQTAEESLLILEDKKHYDDDLIQLLSRGNIGSKESVIRQYDHEVQGGTIVKPLLGKHLDGPGDAAIIRPVEMLHSTPNLGIVIANGICPSYSRFDTYHMAACAVDEAIRNCVSVGCDPNKIAILDNFCWPDPVYHPEKTPDGKYKLAQLIRANQALYDYSLAFGVPIISGKDSMKNDYKIEGTKISILPTLLVSSLGIIPDLHKAVSMDVKSAGDLVYIIGTTKDELGGSEYAAMLGLEMGKVPKVDAASAKKSFQVLYQAICQGWVASCHDCSDGGLAVALAESAFAGEKGMEINLRDAPHEGLSSKAALLFSESPSRFIVTINPLYAKEFERAFKGISLGRIGVVTETPKLIIKDDDGENLIQCDLSVLKNSWKSALTKGAV